MNYEVFTLCVLIEGYLFGRLPQYVYSLAC